MFPEIFNEFSDWGSLTTFKVIKKTLQDGEVIESAPAEKSIDCIVYPAADRTIALKPEGQRRWKWMEMICEKNLKLDSIIQLNSDKIQYRVWSSKDWSIAGFYVYSIAQAYISTEGTF